MGSCLMDTMDGKKVTTVDIPGAFLQGDWPQDEHPGYIMFEGIMVDMIYKLVHHIMTRSYGAKIVRENSYTVVSSRQYTGRY